MQHKNLRKNKHFTQEETLQIEAAFINWRLTPPYKSSQADYIDTHERADKTQNYELLTAKLYFKLCLQYYLEPQKLKSELTELGFSPVREDKAALFAHTLKLRNTEADYYITPWQDGILMAGFAKDGSSCHFGHNF